VSALREIDPDVRVLVASGQHERDGAKDILALGARGFLQKPFELEQLSREVSAALEDVAPLAS